VHLADDEGAEEMGLTERGRRAWIATAMAVVIGGGGVAIGAAAFRSSATGPAPAAAATSAPPPASAPALASYENVVRQVLPSVVLIRTPNGLGSGVVLDGQGNIVTNAHVAADAAEVEVQVAGQAEPRPAKLVGTYRPDDLAVIRADDPAGLTPARFGDSSKARAGDVVLAVGNPLVNTSGEVIGIPTLAAASPQSGAQAQGIGFAIPANLARDIANQLIASGHVTNSHRAAIGAQVATVAGADGAPAGVGIVAVTPGGPADRAVIRSGDVIRSFGRTPTPDMESLTEALAGARPGQTVTLTIARDDQTLRIGVRLGELPGG
jgi:S1-C subfamily serine protease